MPYGLIAGNGRFPILALETARQMGVAVVAIGIKEEAAPEIEALAARTYWISLGALGKLIDICRSEGITELMMAGQVKHASIFSSIAPDWRLAKLLFSLKEKNTEALIGGVAEVLAAEGIRLVDSTLLLKPLLAGEGVLTRRKPNADEEKRCATAAASPPPWPVSTSARPWPSATAPAWRSRPWRVPTPCCAAPPGSPTAIRCG